MILAKVKDRVLNVDQKYIRESNINTQQFLLDNNFGVGSYVVTFYSIQDSKVFNSSLIINTISSNKQQCKCSFSENVNQVEIEEFQNWYQENDSTTKVLARSSNNILPISFIKYNFFKQYYVLRFKGQIQFQIDQNIQLVLTSYQPIIESITLMRQNYNSNQFISIQPPEFYDYQMQSQSLQNLTISDLLSSTSSFTRPLLISAINQTIYYDYSNPYDYVHFGSYQSRLKAFVRKYSQIQDIKGKTISGSFSSILEGFNSFERGCLYGQGLVETGSNNRSIENIVSTTSSIFTEWYLEKYNEAVQYDKINVHALRNFIPQSIYQDDRNEDLITLVNLIGDTYDQYWSVIKSIKQFSGLLQNQLQNYNQVFLKDLLRNFGFQYQRSFPTSQLPQNYIQIGGMTTQKYNRVLLSRLVSNMPILLKSKGTRQAIQQILNIYGYSQNIIRVNQYRKTGYTGSNIINQIKPYYDTNFPLSLNINYAINSMFIYFRVGQPIDTIINGKLSYINFQPNNSYMSFLRVSGSNLLIKNYKNGVLFNQGTRSGTNIMTCSFNSGVCVDCIKVLNTYVSGDQDIYSLGKNLITKRQNIAGLYDFNQLNPLVITSSTVNLNYTSSGLKIGNFNTIQYSTIFSIANTPSKYFQLQDVSESVTLSIANNLKSQQHLNRSNILIGSQYSDRINSQFVVDYSRRFQDLLDNQRGQYTYKGLKDYRQFYLNNYLHTQVVPYQTMSKFYQQLDNTVFKTIKSFIPQTIQVKYGLLLDNDILTRNRIPQTEYISPKALTMHVLSRQDLKCINIKRKNVDNIRPRINLLDFNPIASNNFQENIINKINIINNTNMSVFTYDVEHHFKTNIRRSNIINIRPSQALYRLLKIKVNQNLFSRISARSILSISQGVKLIEGRPIQKKMIIDQKQQLSITNIKI